MICSQNNNFEKKIFSLFKNPNNQKFYLAFLIKNPNNQGMTPSNPYGANVPGNLPPVLSASLPNMGVSMTPPAMMPGSMGHLGQVGMTPVPPPNLQNSLQNLAFSTAASPVGSYGGSLNYCKIHSYMISYPSS
jgi:hypothetical protein